MIKPKYISIHSSSNSNLAQIGLSNNAIDDTLASLIFPTLKDFASNTGFRQATTVAFGNNFNTKKLEALHHQWAAGNFSQFPTIKILSASDLGGARAAFAQTTNTIYISADFVAEKANNPSLFKDVLLEEIGHFIDAKINKIDTQGDEGKIFAKLVQGRAVSEQELQQFQQAKDAISIKVNGKTLAAEADIDPASNLQFLPAKVDALFDKIKSIINDNIPSTSDLPLIGNKLDLKASINTFIDDVKNKVVTELGKGQENTVAAIQQALFNALSSTNLLLDSDDPDSVVTINDIQVIQDNSSIAFKFNIGTVAHPNISLDKNLGLPNLGLDISGGLSADLDISLGVGFGVDNFSNDQNAIFLDTSAAKEFQAHFQGKLVDGSNNPLTLDGTLGFLHIEATDQGSALTADFAADLKGGDAQGKIRFNNLDTIDIDADALTVDADLKLFIDTGISDPNTGESLNGPLPSITANFDLLDLQFNSDNPSVPAPIVKFTDAKLNFGSLVSGFFKSVFTDLQTITNPFKPIINTLTTPLPVIRASLLDIAEKVVNSGLFGSGTIDPETFEFVKIAVKIVNVIDSFPTSADSLFLDLGDFDLTGTDVRTDDVSDNSKVTPNITKFTDPLNQVSSSGNGDVTPFINALIDLVTNIQDSSVFKESAQFVDNNPALAAQSLQSLADEDTNSIKQLFPILADPSSVFQILLGQQVDLFRYDSPTLAFKYTFTPPTIPIFGPLGLQISGGVSAGAAISVGYDTQGLIDFRKGDFADASKLLNGFFAGRPISDKDGDGDRDHNLTLGGELDAAAALDLEFIKAALGGGIGLTVFFDLGNSDNDYKIRSSDIANVIDNGGNPFCLFSPSGELDAIIFGQITLDFGFFSFSKRLNLATIKLVSFTAEDFGGNPCAGEESEHYNVIDKEPDPDSPIAKQLAGAGIVDRTGTDNNDIIIVEHISGGVSDDGSSDEIVEVQGLDPQPKQYANVKLVIVSAGEGNDTITFINDVEANGQVTGGAGDDNITTGEGDDFLLGGAGNDTLDGGEVGLLDTQDKNTADYSDAPNGIVVNLTQGKASNDGYGTQDILIHIQNIVGSSKNDSITGSDDDNVLVGDQGNDTLIGLEGDDVLLSGAGADYIDGGDDEDTITYIASMAGVYVNISNSNVAFVSPIDKVLSSLPKNRGFGGEANGDKIFNVENLQGSIYNDILVAGDEDGHVSGLNGDDILIAGPGDDTLDGGTGNDWVSYIRATQGVEVHLVEEDGNTDGGASGDKLLSLRNKDDDPLSINSIENLQGSNFADTLEGDIGSNILRGEGGSDTLKGNDGNDTLIGGVGADFLDGGASIDWADYSESPGGVNVSLLPGAVNTGGHGQGDTFAQAVISSTVENLLGSDFADILTGDAGNNDINPGLSNFGTDVVDGGSGSDRLIIDYSRNDFGTGVIGGFSNFANPTDSFSRGSGTNPPVQDAVTFKNIERLKVTGTSKADQIFGGADDDVILGGAGNDIIAGGRGNNVILADDGNDFVKDQNDANLAFSGTPGNSFIVLNGGAGIDTLSIDLSGKADNITLVSLNPGEENPNQLLTLSDGSVITQFEAFRDIKTGFGKDQLTQLGKLDNNFSTGGGNDTINSGLGLDTVDGGSSSGDDDLLIVDYSVGDVGSGIQSFFNGTNGGEIYRNITSSGNTLLDRVTFSNIERLNVIGTSKADQLVGGNGADTLIGNDGDDSLIGNKGSDSLFGSANNDILIGVKLGVSPGSGNEIDSLTGGTGKDEFWLGDAREVYYDDETPLTSGFNNQGQITDFNPDEGDIIQLHGKSGDYILKEIRTGTQIFLRGSRTSADELIGFVQGFSKFDLNASYVRYVDSSTGAVSANSVMSLKALPVETNAIESLTDNITANTLNLNIAEALIPAFTVTQNNGNGFGLLDALTGITTGLSNFNVKLTGDTRAFGTFQNDPFGLGSGIVLSTGKVKDLAGGNTADGDFSPGTSVPIQLTKLSGVTGGSPAETAVYVADLSNLGFDLSSLTIGDGGVLAGSNGRFTGFDLDAIKLSHTLVNSAADAASLVGLDVFDFSPAGTTFIPGEQRPPTDPTNPNLFGTTNGYINNAIAKLTSFDANSTIGPTATGFVSLGDSGKVGFDLKSSIASGQPLYLYLGEVGDNGEVAAGDISVSNRSFAGLNDLSTDFGTPGAADDNISMQIDFVADDTAPLIYFQFAFASEEFVEFGGSDFNDLFSLKLNGLDLALLSDDEAVTINNLAPTPFGYHPDFIYNPSGTGPATEQTRLDGYTKVLTFAGPTITNAKNSLILNVKDVRDGLLDSAIFLKAATLGTVDPNNLPGSVRVDTGKDLVVAEGGTTDTFTFVLKTIPKDNVTVTLTPDKQLDLGQGANNPTTLTFTPGNALIAQTVTVKAVDDTLVEGNHTGIISFKVNSSDSAYNELPVSDLKVAIRDNDEPAPVFAISSASATEGNPITFTIIRTGDAQIDQSITLATSIGVRDTASERDFKAKAETITFKPGETQKTFTVETIADSLFEGNETFTVGLSKATNGAIINPNGTAKGTIVDAGAIIAQTDGSTNVTEGGTTDSYSVVLTTQPTADVIITINNGRQIRTSTRTLTFTSRNWNIAQNVTVVAVDDAIVEGNHGDSIQNTVSSNDTKYNGIAGSINVSITDNDLLLTRNVGNESLLTNNVDNDIFTIKGDSDQARLKVTLTGHNSNSLNELGVFIVDDASGNINGIKPGTTGYAQAALERAKIIFSTIANAPNGFDTNNLTSLLELNSGDKLRFYLVKNSSTDSVRTGATSIADMLFADASTQKITDLGTDGFSLDWKDGFGTSTTDFKDLVVKIQSTNETLPLGTNLQSQPQGELIDLRGVRQQVKADFVVNREAAFNNFIGFYQVTDENGGIDNNGDGKADILIGQTGYSEAAVRGRIAGIDLTVNNQGTATYTGTFQPGSIFAPFIIANGRPDALIDSNLNNNPVVYFPFLGANIDKVDHIRLLGNNIFGFEDLASGGDKDFNDVIVRVNLSIA
ncbi:choice-of-anchor L domain-containing protein [Nostoc punctiforme UO1]|uniref:choice-of-anchor L domain-containing protein n=1 Tax=Nostoc punctiforme TaxID=272131 RepID=UPI0030AD3993